MSRAQWFAVGSTFALAGCTAADGTGQETAEGRTPNAVTDASADSMTIDAAVNDAVAADADPEEAAAPTGMPCGALTGDLGPSGYCDRATSYCVHSESFDCVNQKESSSYACVPLDCDSGPNECSCQLPDCTIDDAGGVFATDYYSSCNPCYGAPAPRTGWRYRGGNRSRGSADFAGAKKLRS